MISARLHAEELMLARSMMADLQEIIGMIDHPQVPHRGMGEAAIQTDMLRFGGASELWDAAQLVRRSKIRHEMVVQSHQGHDELDRRYSEAERGRRAGAQRVEEAPFAGWPKRYR